jgi:Abnormal spindle-like microcephaly-assoc'd, ASPM-SPD-2-Hydin
MNLSPGQSSSVVVSFSPQTAGKPTGTITLSSSSAALQIAVSGTAVSPGALSLNPASLSFGNVVLGQSQTQNVTVTNSGNSPVILSQASVSSASFTLNGLALPLNLSPGQSQNFTVLFTPQSAGNVAGSIALSGSASLSPQTQGGQTLGVSASVSMSGNGVSSGQLAISPGLIDFGDVATGKASTQAVSVTNGGSSAVTISQAVASGTGFSLTGLTLPATLQSGQSAKFSVIFSPQSAGTVTGKVSISSNATNSNLVLPLSGVGVTPGTLGSNPTSLSFGTVQLNSSRSLSETLTNTGGTTVSLKTATVSGAGISISGLTIPTQLTAGQSVTFNVTFAPTSAGAVSGALTITSTAPNPSLAIALSGTGVANGQLSISPSSLSFGNVTVGSSKGLTSTLTASGSSVTISSATSNSSEFSFSGVSLPTTLSAGQSATFTVTFAPQASGSASASLTFKSNASNIPPAIASTGTGVAAVQHSVSLTWQASTSTVAGYNVYRGTQSGGPFATINSGLVSATDYTDSSVTSGNTYYYVLTSVDAQGTESVQSNQVQAVIPTS